MANRRATYKPTDPGGNFAKAKFLGIKYPAAQGRLRKQVLLNLLQRLGENFCFRCGGEITTVRELSMDHKEYWLYIDVKLFWDLNNIAFSHLKCNVGVQRHGARLQKVRKIGPEGTAWCYKHELFLPVDQFHKSRSRWNGLQAGCKECAEASRVKRISTKQTN